jgi:hypothetical protein
VFDSLFSAMNGVADYQAHIKALKKPAEQRTAKEQRYVRFMEQENFNPAAYSSSDQSLKPSNASTLLLK